MLNTFGVSLVVPEVLPHHHLDLGRVQRIHLPQLGHAVSCDHHTPLVDQRPTAHQLPVGGPVAVASSGSAVPLERSRLARCLGHLCLGQSRGGAAVNGRQPGPVRICRPLRVKGWMLPTHCQRGRERVRGQRREVQWGYRGRKERQEKIRLCLDTLCSLIFILSLSLHQLQNTSLNKLPKRRCTFLRHFVLNVISLVTMKQT